MINNRKSPLLPFALVVSLFFFWGIANNMNDTLLAAFKRIMSMSDLQTSLVQSAFYGSYFCFAIPAALFIRRYGYKRGIMVGLATYAVGTILFLPAGNASSYSFFLTAIYVMAAGCAVLETTANPLVYSMGPAQSATRRLNIAQMFNPLGAVTGILISKHFIFSNLSETDAAGRADMSPDALKALQHDELSAVSSTYMLIGCVLLLLLIAFFFVRMPADNFARTPAVRSGLFSRLWRNKRYRYGVLTLFFYVGAQTCVWSYTIRLTMIELNMLEASASNVFLCSIIAFTAFRFIFTALMRTYRPELLIAIASVCAVGLTAVVIFTNGMVAVAALVGISACMSLMFPTIYGLAMTGLSDSDTKMAGSGLIMSIVGGAVITPVQGYISDVSLSVSLSFVVPLICFIAIFIYSTGIIHVSRKSIQIAT